MSRATATTLLILALLLCSTLNLSCAARPHPSSPADATTTNSQDKGVVESGEIEESCAGVAEEECLMRRTLAAHLDYIYTQKKNP